MKLSVFNSSLPLWTLAFAICLSGGPTVAATLPNEGEYWEYTQGHADIGILYDNDEGALKLHWHFGGGTTVNGESLPGGAGVRHEWAPSSAYARVADTAIRTRPASATWAFVGVGAGEQYWRLPQTGGEAGTLGLPYLGISTESVDVDGLSDPFTPVGAIWPQGFAYELLSYTGPDGGHFSVWQSGDEGPEVFMATYDGVDPSIDRLPKHAGAHDHYNWGFTQEGVYAITLQALGTLDTGDGLVELQSAPATFYFVVGDNTAFSVNGVPEPSTWAIGALGLVGVGWTAVRRRRQMEKELTQRQ